MREEWLEAPESSTTPPLGRQADEKIPGVVPDALKQLNLFRGHQLDAPDDVVFDPSGERDRSVIRGDPVVGAEDEAIPP